MLGISLALQFAAIGVGVVTLYPCGELPLFPLTGRLQTT
jgi:hypothetical protein